MIDSAAQVKAGDEVSLPGVLAGRHLVEAVEVKPSDHDPEHREVHLTVWPAHGEVWPQGWMPPHDGMVTIILNPVAQPVRIHRVPAV